MKNRPDCVVVFKDAIERRMREKMVNSFEGMQVLPTIIVRDDLKSSDELEKSDFDHIMSQNPDNCSVWIRENIDSPFRLAAKPGVDSVSLMSKFFKTEVLRRFADLALTLQEMGVKTIEGRASEGEDESLTKDRSASVKLSGANKAAKASLESTFKEDAEESFKHDVEQSVTYSIDAPLDVSLDEMTRIAASRGLSNEPIVRMVLNAKRLDASAWSSLFVRHKIDATVIQSLNEKIDFALSVCAKLPVGGGDVKSNFKSATEMLSKVVQNFEICVRNK